MLVGSVKQSVYATGSFFYLKLTVSEYEGVRKWMDHVTKKMISLLCTFTDSIPLKPYIKGKTGSIW